MGHGGDCVCIYVQWSFVKLLLQPPADPLPDAAKSVGTKEKLRHSPGHSCDYKHDHASIVGNPQSHVGQQLLVVVNDTMTGMCFLP